MIYYNIVHANTKLSMMLRQSICTYSPFVTHYSRYNGSLFIRWQRFLTTLTTLLDNADNAPWQRWQRGQRSLTTRTTLLDNADNAPWQRWQRSLTTLTTYIRYLPGNPSTILHYTAQISLIQASMNTQVYHSTVRTTLDVPVSNESCDNNSVYLSTVAVNPS